MRETIDTAALLDEFRGKHWPIFASLAPKSEDELRRILRPHDEAEFRRKREHSYVHLRQELDEALDALTMLEIGREIGIYSIKELDTSKPPDLEKLIEGEGSEAFLRYANAYLYFAVRILTSRFFPQQWDLATPPCDRKDEKTNLRFFPLAIPPAPLAQYVDPPTSSGPPTETREKFEQFLLEQKDPCWKVALEFLDDIHIEMKGSKHVLTEEDHDASIDGEDPQAGAGHKNSRIRQYNSGKSVQYELWLRGLLPLNDWTEDKSPTSPADANPATEEAPTRSNPQKAHFEEITNGLIGWLDKRVSFYLPFTKVKVKKKIDSSAEYEPLKPEDMVVVNPIAARFALADIYWISRLLRAEVSANGSVSYARTSWIELLRFHATLTGKDGLAKKLKDEQEIIRAVFDFVCDLVQNAVAVSEESELRHFNKTEFPSKKELPECNKQWRAVFDEELKEIQEQRWRRTYRTPNNSFTGPNTSCSRDPNDGWSERLIIGIEPQNRIGLAFSGGGVRSATFNLGVLQGLQGHDLLRQVDYLSTVSGGGYIGAWLVGNVRRTRHWLGKATCWDESVAHLRSYASYLAPITGLLSADTWTLAASWIRNTFLIQLSGLTWLLIALFGILSCRMIFIAMTGTPDHPHPYVRTLALITSVIVTFNLCRNLAANRTETSNGASSTSDLLRYTVLPSWLGAFFVSIVLWANAQSSLWVGSKSQHLHDYSSVLKMSLSPMRWLYFIDWLALLLIGWFALKPDAVPTQYAADVEFATTALRDTRKAYRRAKVAAHAAKQEREAIVEWHNAEQNATEARSSFDSAIAAANGVKDLADGNAMHDNLASEKSKAAVLAFWKARNAATDVECAEQTADIWTKKHLSARSYAQNKVVSAQERTDWATAEAETCGKYSSDRADVAVKNYIESHSNAFFFQASIALDVEQKAEREVSSRAEARRVADGEYQTYKEVIDETGAPVSLWNIRKKLARLRTNLVMKQLHPVGLRVWKAFWIASLCLVVLYLALSAILYWYLSWPAYSARSTSQAFVFGPALVLSAFTLSITLFIGLSGKISKEAQREWWTRFGAWLTIYAAIGLTASAAAIFGPKLILLLFDPNRTHWSIKWGTILSGLGTVISGLFAGNSSKTSGEGEAGKKPSLEFLARVGGILFVAGFVIGTSYLLYLFLLNFAITDSPSADYWQTLYQFSLIRFVASFAVLLWIGWLFAKYFEINIFGLSQFYRNRLVRCFLGATRWAPGVRKPHPFTKFDFKDDIPLSDLKKDFRGPFPIFNCTLNLAGSSDLTVRTRHSASFSLTPLYCGADRPKVGYAPTGNDNSQKPTFAGGVKLGQAIAVSGAAVSPNMGYNTSPLVALLLTMFNVRLGWWFPNPGKRAWNERGLHYSLYYLAKELLGIANENRQFLNVTDGGHFENLGVYELIRRRCKVIIACDAECDEVLQFGALGNLVRICATDFGAVIDIDVKSIREQKDGHSLAHCTVGKIKYSNGSIGYLIYLKASVTGDEDIGIAQYRSVHPSFPHETTANQFFTEDQFESYRKLGLHIVRHALRGSQPGDDPLVVAEKLADVTAPMGVAGEAFLRHTYALQHKWEEFRHAKNLHEFVEELMSPTPPKQKTFELSSDELCMALELIQLMEDVYMDLRLDDFWEHPDNRGWAIMFMRWARSPRFQAAWARTHRTFGIRFEYFCEARLGLTRDTPIVRV